MKKIIIICMIIIICVVLSDLVFEKIMFKNFDYLISLLEKVEYSRGKEYNTEIIDEAENIINNKSLLMAFYIDHGEIENIKTQIVMIRAGIESKDESFFYEEVQRTIFIINNLEEKIEFKLENIL